MTAPTPAVRAGQKGRPMQLASLYRCAQRNHIPVLHYPLPRCGSLSVQTEGRCVIGMDRQICDNAARERTHLSHELGHCLTGSFYNRYSPYDLRQRHENRADKWAIRCLVTEEALDNAGVTLEDIDASAKQYQTSCLSCNLTNFSRNRSTKTMVRNFCACRGVDELVLLIS